MRIPTDSAREQLRRLNAGLVRTTGIRSVDEFFAAQPVLRHFVDDTGVIGVKR